MPRVSVIIPSYNHEKYISEAIESVLEQTYQDFEIVVTDDGSSDGTVEKIKKFTDSRIKLFCFDKNQGASVAVTNCLEHVKGEYIAMLSSDDIFFPDKLQKQVNFLDRHPEMAAVFGYAQIIDDEGNDFTDESHFYYNIFRQPNRTRFEWLNYFFYNANCLCHPSVLVRRQPYIKLAPPDPRLAQLGDFNRWIKICMKHDIHVMPEDLVKFRIRSGEANVSAPAKKEGMVRFLWEYSKILANYLTIRTVDDFRNIFPEYTRLKFAERLDVDSIPFFLSLLALQTDSRLHHNFALTTLYELLQNHSVARKLKENFNFTYVDFIKLTGAYNIFNDSENKLQLAEKDWQLTEKDHQLAQQVRLISEKDHQLLEKDQLLSQKDHQLSEKEREILERNERLEDKEREITGKAEQLAERDQQLAILNHQLVEQIKLIADNDRRISALLNSLSWRITSPLRKINDVLQIKSRNSVNRAFMFRYFEYALVQWKTYHRLYGRYPRATEIPKLIASSLRNFAKARTARSSIQASSNEPLAVTVESSGAEGSGLFESPVEEALPILDDKYEAWLYVNRWNDKREEYLRRRLSGMKNQPLLSVIMPVYNPPIEFLNRAIASVCFQVYGNWELCVADDASTEGWVRDALIRWAETDKRIKLCFREMNGNISVATNSAASLAEGSHLVFLDQDDILTPDALGEIVLYIADNPNTDILYSDDDKIDSNGIRFAPQFKPDWSPELLLSYMYFSHVFVVRRSLFEEVGGARVGFEGSQDYDLALRASEKAKHIGHIPLVLYHWTALPGSTASSGSAKPDSMEAGRKAVNEALVRRGIRAVAYQPDWAIEAGVGIFSHRFTLDELPTVTIIIPTKDQVKTLKRCVDSILDRTDYPNYEILIIDNDSVERETAEYLKKAAAMPNISTIRIGSPEGRFNFAYLNNMAARSVRSDYVLFLNNDTEVLKKKWLYQMVSYAQIPGVGVVGARLLYPDRSIQHAGVLIKFYHGMAGHAFKGLPETSTGYLGYPKVLRNYTAVTAACLLTPKKLFEEIGGFDEQNFGVAYNDVDYCCRLLDRNYRIVYAPDAELIHHEGKSRGYGDDPAENANFRKKYYGKKDRYYNSSLSLDNEHFEVEPRSMFTGNFSKTIKTLMCAHNLNHEGAPYSQYEMTVGLKERGIIDPVVLSPSDGPLRALYESHGIRVIIDESLGCIFDMAGYKERIKSFTVFIKDLGVEMVYANTLINFHVIAAAKDAGLPSVWNIRESEPWQHYVEWWGAELSVEAARCFAYPYKVIFVAHSTKNLYQPFEAKHNFKVIHNGLNLKRLFEEAEKYDRKRVRRELGVNDDELVILLPGTVCERKGQHDLARAMGMLNTDCLKRIRCFIVGDWLIPYPYSTDLHGIVDRLPKEAKARITIVPVTSEIFKYYKAADIFVCTSRIESFPRITLEAMAFNLPIITTPVFGIQEQVQKDVNAVFYPPGDIEALAASIDKVVRDDRVRKKYAENSLYVLQQIGTFEDMVDCYASVFSEGYLSGNERPHMSEGIIRCKAGKKQIGLPINKVSFLTTYVDEFPQRFRVHNLTEELTAAGIECCIIKDDFSGRLDSLFDSDLLVAFRVGLSENVLRVLTEFQEKSIPTVFDIDDLIFEPELAGLLHGFSALGESERLRVIEGMRRLRESLLKCDYATCTTKSLSKRIEDLGKKCFVISNALNSKQLELAQTLKDDKSLRTGEKIRIGYCSGTNTHDRDFLEVSDALYDVMERNENVEFHLVGLLNLDTRFSKFGTRVIRKPLMEHLNMLRYLAGMDINLAPLETNNVFTAGKSELKIFEAALVGVPTVASSTESYAGCISDGVNGFLAATKDQWVEKLEKLANDKGLRHKVAEEAESEFVRRFSIKTIVDDIIGTYADIVEDYKKKWGAGPMFYGKDKNREMSVDKNYWNVNPEAANLSQWTSNPVIAETVYKRMSGGASCKHWLSWLLEDYFSGKHFKRLLSPGCGTGMHEVIVAKSGVVDEVDAFDFSDAALNLARGKASEANVKINFYKDDINSFSVADKKYDVVLCSGSVHHVRELEYFFTTVRNALAPQGYFILNEYVGDCYNIYNNRQVGLINRLYGLFPDVLRSGRAKIFENQSIQSVLNTDPSESVRSKLVLPFLNHFFKIEIYRPFGGFILHCLYPLLNDAKFSSRTAESETILKLLLEFEAILMESGMFETDFALCVCRPK